MSDLLLSPPVAFTIFLVLVAILYGGGRLLAGPTHTSSMKSSIYSSGEAPPERWAAPGYRPFFVVALFFAILHLGALVLAVGQLSGTSVIYLVGLALALLALILG